MSWDELELRIDQAMLRDRHRLRRRLRSLRRARGSESSRPSEPARTPDLQDWERQLDESCQRLLQRAHNRPQLDWNLDLPILTHRQRIGEMIAEHPVIILCGETGSGKSTQIPKICLELGRGIAGLIGHTQPRRIAARSIATRLADELRSAVGKSVGYKVRFHDTVSDEACIKLMTDGILLAEVEHDRYLEQYDTLIIDEAHERSLNIDFLLGYLRTLLARRRDLRVIIASATLDAERFSAFFGDGPSVAPIIEVSGRGFPVETRYRPLPEHGTDDPNLDLESNDALHAAIARGLEELAAEGQGDVLVFLPTERAIREGARYLRGWGAHQSPRPEILPLYARLSTAEQNRIFQPGGAQRVILATNVAESSLTVPGMRYVIDAGTARISRYSPRTQMQRLPIERISQASANQRQGRCGREQPGICLRLYPEEDFGQREPYTTPEIRRTNLASVLLRLLALRLGEPDSFPLLDPPRTDAIRYGWRTLYELEGVDDQHRLTDLGRTMSRLPVDPRIARILAAGHEFSCLHETLIVAAALEVQDPRLRPPQREMLADEMHSRFTHEDSDFLSYLRLWDYIHVRKSELSKGQFQKAMTQEFLSPGRILEWQDVFVQLKQIVIEFGWKLGARRELSQGTYEAIHRALATGLLAFVAKLSSRHEYEHVRGGRCYLWPGAAPFASRPTWVIAAELVETSRRYLRCVARVEPEWLEQAGDHLVVREYSDPAWSRKLGTVTALERVKLQGLMLVARRSTNYGRVDPGTARRLFIQHALVDGNFRGQFEFFERNLSLIQSLASLAARSRNPAWIAPHAVQYAFYDEHLPDSVVDTQTLHRWLQRNPSARKTLVMRREDLLPTPPAETDRTDDYPSHVQVGAHRLRVSYKFAPERDDDGMTITVDRATLAQLEGPLLEWLVPGLLPEKITSLIRNLPKASRRNLIPAPEVAARVAAQLEFGQGPFIPTVAAALSKMGGELVQMHDFDLEKLSPHLRFHVRVVDDSRKILAEGRCVDAIRKQLSVDPAPARHLTPQDTWHRDHIKQWDFGDLPDQILVRMPGGTTTGYPVLVDGGTEVCLRVFHQRAIAQRHHEQGVRRLCAMSARDALRTQVAWFPDREQCETMFSQIVPHVDFGEQLTDLLAQLAFLQSQPLPLQQTDFEQIVRAGIPRIAECVQDAALLVPDILRLATKVHEALRGVPDHWASTQQEARQHLQQLLTPRFLTETSWNWLQQFPRYLRAVLIRLERMRGGSGGRDVACDAWWQRMVLYMERSDQHAQRGIADPELQTYRWMLEEFRVSLFAQELGTCVKVSPQRLDRQWEKVGF